MSEEEYIKIIRYLKDSERFMTEAEYWRAKYYGEL